MENNAGKSEQAQDGEGQLEFFNRLSNIPLIHVTLLFMIDVYSRAKNSSSIFNGVSKLFEKGLEITRQCLSPLVSPFYPIAAAPLAKVDTLATKGLVTLERTVPVITKQPQEIVSDTKEIISSRVTPAVERLNEVSETVLSSRPAQFTLGCYEKVLAGGSAMVNTVLTSDKEANGFPHEKAPESAVAKPGWLMRESYFLMKNTVNRIFGVAQSRADSVVQSVRKTL